MKIIYKITNLINNKIYIGQTSKDINKRFYRHCTPSKDSLKYQVICRAIKKYGKENFKIEVVESFNDISLSQQEFNDIETKYIAQFNSLVPNGYNIAKIGNKPPGMEGKIFTEEHRTKLSNTHKIRWRNYSNEEKQNHLEKMRLQRIGKSWLTDDGRERKSNYYKKRWREDKNYKEKMINDNLIKAREQAHTIEAEEKRSKSLSKRYHVISPEGIEFCVIGLVDFCKEYKLDNSAISKVAKNKLPHYKKWKVILLDEKRDLKPINIIHLNKYYLKHKDGFELCVYGLEHLKEIELSPTLLARIAKGNSHNKSHKGWTIEKIK